jgi:hypothetical protein
LDGGESDKAGPTHDNPREPGRAPDHSIKKLLAFVLDDDVLKCYRAKCWIVAGLAELRASDRSVEHSGHACIVA